MFSIYIFGNFKLIKKQNYKIKIQNICEFGVHLIYIVGIESKWNLPYWNKAISTIKNTSLNKQSTDSPRTDKLILETAHELDLADRMEN